MTAAELLGLPPATEAEFVNTTLGGEYAAFVNSLEVLPGERVVLADPDRLSVPTEGFSASTAQWYADLSERDRCKLLLLSIVSRPFDRSCLREAVPFGIDTISGRTMLAAEPALKTFSLSLPRQAAIETISSEFLCSQPERYGYPTWQICRWSGNWVVVFVASDMAHDEGYPFPWLLGFCQLEGLERNFVELLRAGPKRFAMGFYWTYGRVFSGWPLARIALVSDDNSEGPDWDLLDWLMELEDSQLQTVLGNFGDPADPADVVRRFRQMREALEYVGLDRVPLAELLHRAGSDGNLNVLAEKIGDWQKALDRQAEDALAERQRKIAQFSDQIAAVIGQIADLPPDTHYTSPERAAWRNEMRRDVVRRHIEDYVGEHSAMPTGKRDFGVVHVRSGVTRTSPIDIGTVDFDHRG